MGGAIPVQLMNSSLIGGFLLAAACLGSCQWTTEDRSLDRLVSSEELVGVWVLNAQSVRDLASLGLRLSENRTAHQIVIESDGTCEFRTFVALDVAFHRDQPVALSSRCRWKLGDGLEQDLEFRLTDLANKVARYQLAETAEDKVVIWQYIADPDFWKYAEYERVAEFHVGN